MRRCRRSQTLATVPHSRGNAQLPRNAVQRNKKTCPAMKGLRILTCKRGAIIALPTTTFLKRSPSLLPRCAVGCSCAGECPARCDDVSVCGRAYRISARICSASAGRYLDTSLQKSGWELCSQGCRTSQRGWWMMGLKIRHSSRQMLRRAPKS